MTVDARYAFLLRVARDAGARARDFWIRRDALTVELKGPQDFVTRRRPRGRDVSSARRSRALFRAIIFSARRLPRRSPATPSACGSSIRSTARTTSCAGSRYWNVSIAYVEDGVRTLGAVYDPAHDELFHARRGGGAFRTDAGGETRIETAATKALAGAMIAVGHSDRALEPR